MELERATQMRGTERVYVTNLRRVTATARELRSCVYQEIEVVQQAADHAHVGRQVTWEDALREREVGLWDVLANLAHLP